MFKNQEEIVEAPSLPEMVHPLIIFEKDHKLTLIEFPRYKERDLILLDYSKIRHKLLEDTIEVYKGRSRLVDGKYLIESSRKLTVDKVIERIQHFGYISTYVYDMAMFEKFCLMIADYFPVPADKVSRYSFDSSFHELNRLYNKPTTFYQQPITREDIVPFPSDEALRNYQEHLKKNGFSGIQGCITNLHGIVPC